MPSHAAEPVDVYRVDAYLVVQVCFVSSFGQHDGRRVFSRLKPGDSLQLRREPENPNDVNAVRIEWQGRTLGYVPGDVNEGIARQLDFGNRLRARISRLSKHRDPDRRVEVEIILPL